MLLVELRIENFRMFGEKENALVLPIRPGLTVFLASLKCSVPELNYCSTLVPVLAIDGRVF